MRISSAITFVLLVSALTTSALASKTYRWEDEKGTVHYSDRVPTEYLKNERNVISEQGLRVEKIDAALTPEQLAEKKRMEREKIKAEEAKRLKRFMDRVLLDTYTTERDILAARDARLVAVDSQVQLAESIINDTERVQKLTSDQIRKIEAKGLKAPGYMYDKIQVNEKKLSIYYKVAASRLQERDEIVLQFDKDMQRFRVLKAEKKARKEKPLEVKLH